MIYAHGHVAGDMLELYCNTYYDYRTSKNLALLNYSAPLTEWLKIVSNNSAKVVMRICYIQEAGTCVDGMLNINL